MRPRKPHAKSEIGRRPDSRIEVGVLGHTDIVNNLATGEKRRFSVLFIGISPRGGPRLAAGPRLGGRTCPRQSQLASQLLNFPSRALRPPLRQHPCLSIRSAHPHPPLARGGRAWFACCVVLVSRPTNAATCQSLPCILRSPPLGGGDSVVSGTFGVYKHNPAAQGETAIDPPQPPQSHPPGFPLDEYHPTYAG
jgi:hypothetical protein